MSKRLGATRIAVGLALVAALPALAQDQPWIRLTTAHFEMYASCDQKKAREAILYFERVRDFFIQASPVRTPTDFPTRIVAFKDADLFHVYAPNPNVAAYYAPGPVRDSIVMQDPSPDSYPVAIHEFVHLIIRHSGLHLPLWLNEGWAEVYSTLRPVKDGVAVGDLIERHEKALSKGRWFSLSQLADIDESSPEYNESGRMGMFYAESWALTHMLYLSPDYKKGFGPFISALSRGRALDDALHVAYGKTEDQVFTDLRNYLERKKLYGTVFLTPFEKSDEKPEVTPVGKYDSYLMLADLHAASHHAVYAARLYTQLETVDAGRPEAFAGLGYLAQESGDKEAARTDFRKAFSLGSTDARLCMQLAGLDQTAKAPASVVMSDLERAVKLQPDFSDAIFQLALLKVDARDFDVALELLGKVGLVSADHMAVFRSAMAYCNLQKGNIDQAREDAAASQRAAKTPEETAAAKRLLALIDARSKGPAAVHPGEKVVRAEGTAIGLKCMAPSSGQMSKMGILIDGKPTLFDMPEPAAVEFTSSSGNKVELRCGTLQPFHLVVEYTPASAMELQSAGIIRRLEF